jgi:bloom syndrome protein
MLTSPITGPSGWNRSKGKGRQIDEGSDDVDLTSDDESEDAFEPAPARLRQNRHRVPLGAPITTDNRMEDLPDLHQASVHQFVDAAKKRDEKIRNQRGVHRKSYFTEIEFREMAINWTLTLNDMIQSGIDEKKVTSYGEYFIPLIEEYHRNYEDMMDPNNNRDQDDNHRNVIDLCSDDDDHGDDDEYDDDDNISEQPSKYFLDPKVQEFNAKVAQAEKLPQQRHDKSEAPKQAQGSFRGRGKRGGRFRKSSRQSNGSASGSGSGSRGGRRSSSGVSKRAGKPSGGSGRKNANIMTSFSKSGGSGRGGMGSGISMMPT